MITSRRSASRSLRYSSFVRANSDVYSLSTSCSAAWAVRCSPTTTSWTLVGEGRVAQDRLVGLEDGRFLRAHLRGHLVVQGPQVGHGVFHGLFESRKLLHSFAFREGFAFRADEDLVDAVGRADRHARRYGNAFPHNENRTRLH